MNYEEYVKLAVRTEKIPDSGEVVMSRQQYRLLHGAIGTAGELMEELITAVHNYISVMHMVASNNQVKCARENLIEELGDIMWYLGVIRNACPAIALTVYQPEGDPMNETMRMRVDSLAVYLGAIVDEVKRHVIYGKDIDVVRLAAAHYGAIRWIEALARGAHSSLEEVMELNISKLKRRYPNDYTDHDALARADKEGESNANA